MTYRPQVCGTGAGVSGTDNHRPQLGGGSCVSWSPQERDMDTCPRLHTGSGTLRGRVMRGAEGEGESSGSEAGQQNKHLCRLSCVALGSPAERIALGRVKITPSCLTSEPAAVVRWPRRQWRDLSNFLFKENKKNKISQASPRSGQVSKSPLFALSATETGLTTAANPNIARGLTKG